MLHPSIAFLSICGAALLLADSVSTGVLRFSDVAQSAGIRAEMRCGGPEKRWIPEANGSGVAWLDYDNDGNMDLLIVNGGSMDQLRKTLAGETLAPVQGGVYLFHNLGNGKFEDVTARSGLVNPYWGTGANAVDYDNDGFTDILITTIGRDLLYRNNGDGTFTLVSQKAGLRSDVAWHTGSAFGDFDGDGFLDLFIASYIDIQTLDFNRDAPVCDYFGQHVFCGPIGLKGGRSIFYHNNGDGTFTDATATSGIARAPAAHSFTPLAADLNGDGKLDIFVANDSDPNFLFVNQGDGKFKESALDRGVAFNADGRAQSNMGVAIGEYGASGRLDILTTTFSRDYFPLFRQNKAGSFDEVASEAGVATATSTYLGWACGLKDFDNSGHRDFWTANGHVYPTDKNYFEPIAIFRSVGSGKTSLAYSFPPKLDNSYRGGAAGDYNNDGLMDLVVLPVDGSPVLLQNQTNTASSWMGLLLRGGTHSSRDAIGASAVVTACGHDVSGTIHNGGGYLSRDDPRIHFGLGSCKTVDRISIKWPDGKTQLVTGLPVNRYSTIAEAK